MSPEKTILILYKKEKYVELNILKMKQEEKSVGFEERFFLLHIFYKLINTGKEAIYVWKEQIRSI